jgi:hypothetical protein
MMELRDENYSFLLDLVEIRDNLLLEYRGKSVLWGIGRAGLCNMQKMRSLTG